MTSALNSHWNDGMRLHYRMSVDSDILYERVCLYQSTALAESLATIGDTAPAHAALHVLASDGWQSLGTLDQLQKTTWVRFEVDSVGPTPPKTLEYLRNRVRGNLAVQGNPARMEYLSVVFAYREEARAALTRAEKVFDGFRWSERSDNR